MTTIQLLTFFSMPIAGVLICIGAYILLPQAR